MIEFGDRNNFAIEIGQFTQKDLREINVFVAGRNTSCDDNHVYIPQFKASLDGAIDALSEFKNGTRFANLLEGKTIGESFRFIKNTRDEESPNYLIDEEDNIFPYYRFMDWGPTTDNVSCFLIPHEKTIHLAFEFWRDEHLPRKDVGVIWHCSIQIDSLINTLQDALKFLSRNR